MKWLKKLIPRRWRRPYANVSEEYSPFGRWQYTVKNDGPDSIMLGYDIVGLEEQFHFKLYKGDKMSFEEMPPQRVIWKAVRP